MSSITVVIPAYNEEARIAATIRAVQTIPGVEQLFVINDGSTDDTSLIARQEGAAVIDLYPNRGKGGAMNASLDRIDSDIVVFLDADWGRLQLKHIKLSNRF
ncbi:glycosyltransferase family 2 protein [Syntrophomonas palmitatica]|uniref:glycosyltransferase family 2 protein n=1 Tax=Syntrophomonas palmitatica TaxID=402877 RepID=UPI000A82DA5A